jgi:hypothetical protein
MSSDSYASSVFRLLIQGHAKQKQAAQKAVALLLGDMSQDEP